MKYIKKFENNSLDNTKYKIGDYIICDVNQRSFPDLYEFLKLHIGRVVNIVVSSEPYHVRFNVDKVDDPRISKYCRKQYRSKKITIAFNPNEVKYFSENKKELEIKKETDKYNL